jgi:hypothetical protein
MKKKIRKNIQPIEIDAHLRYVCKNPDCGYTHWLSLKETQTRNFKVVCDCGFVFKPKQILKLKIVYSKPKTEPVVDDQKHFVSLSALVAQQQDISLDLLNKCIKILVGYGFTKPESEQLLRNSFRQNPVEDCALLIKQTLESFGDNNNEEERNPSF